MTTAHIVGFTVGFISAGGLMLWREYLYYKILQLKGDNEETECIFGKFYVIVPEKEFLRTKNR